MLGRLMNTAEASLALADLAIPNIRLDTKALVESQIGDDEALKKV